MEASSHKRTIWRPYDTEDLGNSKKDNYHCEIPLSSCLPFYKSSKSFSGSTSPPKKRTRIFFTDEQRKQIPHIMHDPQTRALVEEELTKDLKQVKREIQVHTVKRN